MFIHIRSVFYADNKDDEFFVFDFIDNSVVARSDTVGISPLKFFVPLRPGILFKLVNGLVYFFKFTVGDFFVILNCSRREEDFIHAAF